MLCIGAKIFCSYFVLEAQWGYHTLKKHDLGDSLFEILEGWGT
jgi:hypothetical protein